VVPDSELSLTEEVYLGDSPRATVVSQSSLSAVVTPDRYRRRSGTTGAGLWGADEPIQPADPATGERQSPNRINLSDFERNVRREAGVELRRECGVSSLAEGLSRRCIDFPSRDDERESLDLRSDPALLAAGERNISSSKEDRTRTCGPLPENVPRNEHTSPALQSSATVEKLKSLLEYDLDSLREETLLAVPDSVRMAYRMASPDAEFRTDLDTSLSFTSSTACPAEWLESPGPGDFREGGDGGDSAHRFREGADDFPSCFSVVRGDCGGSLGSLGGLGSLGTLGSRGTPKPEPAADIEGTVGAAAGVESAEAHEGPSCENLQLQKAAEVSPRRETLPGTLPGLSVLRAPAGLVLPRGLVAPVVRIAPETNFSLTKVTTLNSSASGEKQVLGSSQSSGLLSLGSALGAHDRELGSGCYQDSIAASFHSCDSVKDSDSGQ